MLRAASRLGFNALLLDLSLAAVSICCSFSFHFSPQSAPGETSQPSENTRSMDVSQSKSNPTNTIQRIFKTQTHLAIKCNKGQSKLNPSQSLRHIQKLGRTIPRAVSHFCSSCLPLQHSWLNLYVLVFSEKKKKKNPFFLLLNDFFVRKSD